MSTKINLSVIILSYNTKELTQGCISSLIKCLGKKQKIKSEIIVVDNGSSDGSCEMLKKLKHEDISIKKNKIAFHMIFNQHNVGYPKGNNQGLKSASGKYILFLNSDTIVNEIDFNKLILYLDTETQIGVMTVKVVLPNGEIDPASHRGFPTPWNSFCYFVKLEKFFQKIPYLNKLFGGYHLLHLDLSQIHEIDSATGAFYLTRKSILDRLGGFDEDFFMYGEDIDLSYRIKKRGYKVIYYPKYQITHLKGASGIGNNEKVSRVQTRRYFYDSMKIFYQKHYATLYPKIVNKAIYQTINFLKLISN